MSIQRSYALACIKHLYALRTITSPQSSTRRTLITRSISSEGPGYVDVYIRYRYCLVIHSRRYRLYMTRQEHIGLGACMLGTQHEIGFTPCQSPDNIGPPAHLFRRIPLLRLYCLKPYIGRSVSEETGRRGGGRGEEEDGRVR